MLSLIVSYWPHNTNVITSGTQLYYTVCFIIYDLFKTSEKHQCISEIILVTVIFKNHIIHYTCIIENSMLS